MDVDGGAAPVEDFFVGDQAVQDDYGGGGDFGAGGDEFGGETGSADAESGQQNGGATRSGPFVPFDPGRAPNERDLVMAMTDAEADGGMMNYFDQNFLKNWAGPEHWKLRRAVKRREFIFHYRCLLSDDILKQPKTRKRFQKPSARRKKRSRSTFSPQQRLRSRNLLQKSFYRSQKVLASTSRNLPKRAPERRAVRKRRGKRRLSRYCQMTCISAASNW